MHPNESEKPSELLKRIEKAFQCSEELAKLVAYVVDPDGNGASLEEKYETVKAFYGVLVSEHDTLYGTHGWVRETPNKIEAIMAFLDALLGCHGVEGIEDPTGEYHDSFRQSFMCDYLNQGERYTDTLIYDDRSGDFSIGSWGDIVDELERPEDEDESMEPLTDEEDF